MTKNIKAFVLQLLLEKGPLPSGTNSDDYHYLDNGHIDSLSFIKFIFRIEEQFGISFSDKEIISTEIRTIGGLVKLISARNPAHNP